MKIEDVINLFKRRVVKFLDNNFGDYSYKKFVVITRSRTGSNLLISLINSHKEIDAYKVHFRLLKGKSCRQIWKETFPKKRKVKWVGFKIFYYHPEDCDDKEVWDIIRSDPNVRIIHLIRNNHLRVHISRLIAGKNDKWVDEKGVKTRINEKQVNVDIERFFEDAKTTENWQRQIESQYKTHEIINVYYEELISDRSKVMSEIFNFLHVTNLHADSKLEKQNSERIEDLVLNYEELRNSLVNTKYAHMLED